MHISMLGQVDLNSPKSTCLVDWRVSDWVFDLKTAQTEDQALVFPAYAAGDGIFVLEQNYPNFQTELDRTHSNNAWTYPDQQQVVEQGAVVAEGD